MMFIRSSTLQIQLLYAISQSRNMIEFLGSYSSPIKSAMQSTSRQLTLYPYKHIYFAVSYLVLLVMEFDVLSLDFIGNLRVRIAPNLQYDKRKLPFFVLICWWAVKRVRRSARTSKNCTPCTHVLGNTQRSALKVQ